MKTARDFCIVSCREQVLASSDNKTLRREIRKLISSFILIQEDLIRILGPTFGRRRILEEIERLLKFQEIQELESGHLV